MTTGTELLEALPVAVYTTDAEGRITFFNEAAATFWGRRPTIGEERWSGAFALYHADGRPLPHDQCPMAVTLKTGEPVCGVEALAGRPDGSRIPFQPHPTLLKDASGRITGAINLLVEIADRKKAEIDSARLAAIVASSDDAVISKTLDGIVTSWNAGAKRIFGYEASEMIGQSILRLIPAELRFEEEQIIAKLKRGERIEHFDTTRLAKDGSRIAISLTVSPMHDRAGNIIGASKVARDIRQRRESEELQTLLFDELNHRVKNTLAIIQAIAGQSLRTSRSADDFVMSFSGRVQSLARAHDLLVKGKMKGADVMAILREQVLLGEGDGARIWCSGPFLSVSPKIAVQLALVLHELATNARKHGALSVPGGRLSIEWKMAMTPGRELQLTWTESGVAGLRAPAARGFGTTLIERTLQGNGGGASVRFGADGIVCEIKVPLIEEYGHPLAEPHTGDLSPAWRAAAEPDATIGLQGKRILVVEDEPMIAMDLEAQLEDAGCTVIGPAETLATARRLIVEAVFDGALLDANLGGERVDELAALLTQKGIPFAFASGYGREALPREHREAPLLEKPFVSGQLVAVLGDLLSARAEDPGVIPFRPRKG
ncbi:hypothetical protein sos41_33790 [Alphaproteobacteria bacterium SO-S41]|nr:hypothetical protein sos41_33790 [Alphaproteobacteria bacterium SO-S41]